MNVVYAIDVLGGAQFTYLIEYKMSKRIKIAHARREVSFFGTGIAWRQRRRLEVWIWFFWGWRTWVDFLWGGWGSVVNGFCVALEGCCAEGEMCLFVSS